MYMTLHPNDETWTEHEGTPTLEDMQRVVSMDGEYDDLVDRYALPDGIDLWVNDSGLITNMPICLVIEHEGRVLSALAGPILAARHDHEGNTIGLTRADANRLRSGLGLGFIPTPDGVLVANLLHAMPAHLP